MVRRGAALPLLAAACVPAAASAAAGWRRLPQSDVPFGTLSVRSCGGGPCSAAALAEACDATPGCAAFNSAGALKRCAGCELGSDCCIYPQGQPYPPADAVDLWVRSSAPPSDWAAAVADGTMLYSKPEPGPCYMPEVGNGYVASVVGWASMHVGGLFNGKCGGVHKARLPSPVAGVALAGAEGEGALDMVNGLYRRRYRLGDTVVEQRIAAHRTRRSVLFTEFDIVSGRAEVQLNLTTLYDPGCPTPQNSSAPCDNPGGRMVRRPDGSTYPYYGMRCRQRSDCGQCAADGACWCDTAAACCRPARPCNAQGNGCAGSFSNDFDWTEHDSGDPGVSLHSGLTLSADDSGARQEAAIAADIVPAAATLRAGAPLRFAAAVAVSVGAPAGYDARGAALRELREAKGNASGLMREHTAAWGALTAPRVEIAGASARARELRSHFWSSYYYTMSSIRPDWTFGGVSPGGLATQNYQGAVFFDMDWYIAAGVLLLQPELAGAAAQYRIRSVPAARQIAAGFGYNGTMFAWTSAAGGRPFGCCSCKGGFEDCIEQHVTPDVAFFMQQLYRATGDRDWLRGAWEVVRGVAEWVVSRVEQSPDGGYHIRRVMPVDEWCDQLSGCASPGVDDDPQMNAAARVALRFAVEAAGVLGEPVPPEWGRIAAAIVIPYSSEEGVHAMPAGTVTTSRHTSCPEDVNYLSYPLGPSLNMTPEQTRRDMQYWSPGHRTCLENAGMTAPIHVVSWLMTDPQNVTGAHQALNRSLLAACYGPFNVRNEVDVHNTTVGGHFNNTHFLTGDGGFLQALINGYAGLQLAAQDGLRLRPPVLPEGADRVALRGARYLGWTLDFAYNATDMTWAVAQGPLPGPCLHPAVGKPIPVVQNGVSIPITAFVFVSGGSFARLGHC